MIPEYLDKHCIVYQRDGVEFINMLHAESVQLIFTDPPGTGDSDVEHKNHTLMESIELCAAMADASMRALSPSGVLAISLAHANTEGVVPAISKRTHLQFGGYIIDSDDLESTIIVFHKGDPQFNEEELENLAHYNTPIIDSFIMTHTRPGDIVVDPFCGTGDVMEAAVQLGRIAIVNDQDPQAVAATIRRYKERCAE